MRKAGQVFQYEGKRFMCNKTWAIERRIRAVEWPLLHPAGKSDVDGFVRPYGKANVRPPLPISTTLCGHLSVSEPPPSTLRVLLAFARRALRCRQARIG